MAAMSPVGPSLLTIDVIAARQSVAIRGTPDTTPPWSVRRS